MHQTSNSPQCRQWRQQLFDMSWTLLRCLWRPLVKPPTDFNTVLHNLLLADCPFFSHRKCCQIPLFLNSLYCAIADYEPIRQSDSVNTHSWIQSTILSVLHMYDSRTISLVSQWLSVPGQSPWCCCCSKPAAVSCMSGIAWLSMTN